MEALGSKAMTWMNQHVRIRTAALTALLVLGSLSSGRGDVQAAGTLLKPYSGQSPESHISDAASIGAEAIRVADVAAPRDVRIWGSQSFAAAYPAIRHYQLGEPGQVSDNDYQEWAWEIANAIKYANPNAKTYLANQPGATQLMNGWTSCGGPNGTAGNRLCFDGTVIGNSIPSAGYTIIQGPIQVVQNADVAITGIVTSAPAVNVGDPLTYSITVRNAGPVQATNVTVIDDLAEGLSFSPAASPGCSISVRRVTCAAGTLPANQSRTMTIWVTTALHGQFNNGAAVSSSQPDPNPANNTAFAPLLTVNPPACSARPQIQTNVAKSGDGRLRVTVTTAAAPGAPSNRLERLVFNRSDNALVGMGVNGQIGWNVARPYIAEDRPAALTFYLARGNTSAPATLDLTVEDNCGAWRTFVGGGPAAFQP